MALGGRKTQRKNGSYLREDTKIHTRDRETFIVTLSIFNDAKDRDKTELRRTNNWQKNRKYGKVSTMERKYHFFHMVLFQLVCGAKFQL